MTKISNGLMAQYSIDGVKCNLELLACRLESLAEGIRNSDIKISSSGEVEVGQASPLYSLREMSGQLSREQYLLVEAINVLEHIYTHTNAEFHK